MNLTLEGFQAWLEGFEFSAVVGETQQPRRCPLSRYLGGCVVTGREYIDGSSTTRPLPKWAETFVGFVDAHPGSSQPVIAGEALDILQCVVELLERLDTDIRERSDADLFDKCNPFDLSETEEEEGE